MIFKVSSKLDHSMILYSRANFIQKLHLFRDMLHGHFIRISYLRRQSKEKITEEKIHWCESAQASLASVQLPLF